MAKSRSKCVCSRERERTREMWEGDLKAPGRPDKTKAKLTLDSTTSFLRVQKPYCKKDNRNCNIYFSRKKKQICMIMERKKTLRGSSTLMSE